MNGPRAAPSVLLALAALGCGTDPPASRAWTGTIDTLATGQVVVHNPAEPLWLPGEEWSVVLEARIGAVDGSGPDVFGQIYGFDIDDQGRIWVLDGQAQEIRVFDRDGAHAFTVGREGEGPGEFRQAVRVDTGPDGRMWVMDPRNNRLSFFGADGGYLGSEPFPAGFFLTPWPGGFDTDGRYYAPSIPETAGGIRIVRHDVALTPTDTMVRPRDPTPRARWSHMAPDGNSGMSAAVPFQGGFTSRLGPDGRMWGLITDEYRLVSIDAADDTVRTITRAFSALPVTALDRERARSELAWFEERGGTIDWSMLPATKPVVRGFFMGDDGGIWVEREPEGDETGALYDVFDPEGRYLGEVTLPFAVELTPPPRLRDAFLHGVIRDELDVQYAVRYRIVKGG